MSFTKGEDVAEEMFVLMWIDEDYVGHPLEIDSSVSRIDQLAVHDQCVTRSKTETRPHVRLLYEPRL